MPAPAFVGRCGSGVRGGMAARRTPSADVVDVSVASVARMNDYLLGGKDHYPADREACEKLLALAPSSRVLAAASHRYLLRTVRRLSLGFGVQQFVCFGAGLPTPVTAHQVAQRANPRARVVYVDDDPLVLAHGRAVLEDGRSTRMVRAASWQAPEVLAWPQVEQLIDLRRPVAVLFVSLLQHLEGQQACAQLLHGTAQRLAPGSFLVASQRVSQQDDLRAAVTQLMRECQVRGWGHVRSPQEIDALFAGWQMLAPGLIDVAAWLSEHELAPRPRTQEWYEYGGVARVG
ncbi:SAM-dependent methyltransferase [Streptomyces sp. NPDC058644]|uniref:SAM-dependent methyltransferase n=1 Tax=unclassified Streptomyces TaxID=2593676 RepID=UPI00364E61DC